MTVYPALRFVLALTWALASSLAAAQTTGGVKPRHRLKAPEDDSETETTLEIDDGAFLGYGGFRWGTQLVNGKWAPSFGGRGAWLMQETWALGLDFASVLNPVHPFDDPETERITQYLGTWGVVIEKIYFPRRELHWHGALTLGRGVSGFDAPADVTLPEKYEDTRIFYYIAPEVSAVVNLTKYTKPIVGASLRIPFAGIGNSTIKDSDLISLWLFVGVNVGNFTL